MYASGYSIFIPITAGIFKIKTLSNVQRVLFLYLLVAAITDISSLILRTRSESTLHAIQNLFTFSEYIFLFSLFYLELGYRTARVFVISAFIVCVFTFVTSFYDLDFLFFRNDLTTSVESVFIVTLCVIFFVTKLSSDITTPALLEYPFFWIATGLAIYFATALVIFLKNDYLIKHEEEFRFYHTMQRVLNLFSNITFAIALWLKKRA